MNDKNHFIETMHFDRNELPRDNDNIHRELVSALDNIYYTFLRIELLHNSMYLLQCSGHPELIGITLDWEEYLENTSGVYLPAEREKVLTAFSCENLLRRFRSGETCFTMDALYLKQETLNSMKLLASFQNNADNPIAYVAVRDSSMDCLHTHIINKYVYSNCDYFIYLDAKHNSYTMFSGTTDGTPLPPSQCNNYMDEIITYVEHFVVPEDKEYVIHEITLEHVLAQLEHQEVHSFSYGVLDPVKGYTRKRLEYRYYEKNTQTILLSRTDITDIYLEEEAKRRELTAALEQAQADSLTGLLNYQGMMDHVTELLNDRKDIEQAALLFLDLDNFKTVNDTFGHDAGDQVLRHVASILLKNASGTPRIGRVGGDEFVVFFPQIDSMKEVTAYAGTICRAIADLTYASTSVSLEISCSIGIAQAPKDGNTYKTLTKKADEMTYYAKANGKNQYAVYGTV